VGFLGFFPKLVFQALHKYDNELQRCSSVKNDDFKILIDDLIAAFVYRPITIQKAIQILLAKHKTILAEFMKETTSDTNHYDNNSMITTTA